jgi:S1-C subfamily serine protease
MQRMTTAALLLHALLMPPTAVAQSAQHVVRDLGGRSADTTTALALSSAFRAAADRTLAAVVFIAVDQEAPGLRPDQLDALPDPLREHYRPPQGARRGMGSGVIIAAAGHILTNNACSRGSDAADSCGWWTAASTPRESSGATWRRDIAVIKIDPVMENDYRWRQFADCRQRGASATGCSHWAVRSASSSPSPPAS